MNALLILYAGSLSEYAFLPVFNEKNSVSLALEQAKKFPGTEKTVLFAGQGDFSFLNGAEIEQRDKWTKRSVLERISELQTGFDVIYFAWADCPFLDPELAGALAKRHFENKAEYSYADGYPYGLAPEILSAGTAGILAKIMGEDGNVERDLLFSVIQKDINAFDIEAEISNVDLRCHRINLNADTKRNLMLIKNFLAVCAKIPTAAEAEKTAVEQPQVLRTLPAFYPVQVYGGCACRCKICPYPLYKDTAECKDYMDIENFKLLLDKIISFSHDAVIDLSLWGEISLHPQKMMLIEEVLKRDSLALIIETSGLGWKNEELEKVLILSDKKTHTHSLPPVSWIVSLDTADPQQYMALRGSGFAQADAFAKKLFSMFPKDSYVQAVRVKGSEEDTEKFYRYWKEFTKNENNIIIQKYDDFCGVLEKKQASDISPVIRQSCWHIMRDMPVLLNGDVPQCREDLSALKGGKLLGNAFNDTLENIWLNGESNFKEQCKNNYIGICAECDEYYTYNF
ncbi:MAG: spiro-SPASM protein [Treponema sp.]|nr:spiro-SPASM protein [Treponema sp.]